jgi:hypothetical protein
MGRFYYGDIEGKFWVAVQSSNDINNLINIKYKTNYIWKVCGCSVEDENLTYCNDCYENREAHKKDVLEEEDYDSDDTIELVHEDNCIDYLIEKNKHGVELLESMDKLKAEINKEILKEIDNIPQTENILNTFSGIFNKVVETLDSIRLNDNEQKKQEELTCRYLLGYQIQYYLKNNDTCYVSCEC